MALHEGHRHRIRERFLKSGFDGFHEHEVLEMILFYGLSRGDTNPLAHRLIDRFGSLSSVLDAPYEELLKVSGIGENSAVLIKMMPLIFREYSISKGKGIIIENTDAAGEYLMSLFIGRTKETFIVICLDSKCKILDRQVLSEGDVTRTDVNIRKIVEMAIRCNAASIIISHNHPGGFAVPTKEDHFVTKLIFDSLKSLNIELLDHIIVADDDFVSFSDSGYFKHMK